MFTGTEKLIFRLNELCNCINNDQITPEIANNKIKLDKRGTQKSIDMLSKTISEIETVLYESYQIEWTYIDKESVGKPLEFFDWTRKSRKETGVRKILNAIRYLFRKIIK